MCVIINSLSIIQNRTFDFDINNREYIEFYLSIIEKFDSLKLDKFKYESQVQIIIPF